MAGERAFGWLALAIVVAMVAQVPVSQGQTLDEALSIAYAGNPTLEAERARLRQADEGVPQALANWRPSAHIEGGVGYERIERTATIAGIDLEAEASTIPRSGTLAIAQPIYRGGRTAAQLSIAEDQVRAQRWQLTNVEQNILLQSVAAYVNVVREEAVLELTKSNQEVIQQQLNAVNERFEVGEVTKTDVAQAESRLARAVAERIQAEGNLVRSRANYLQLIGEMPSHVIRPPLPESLPASEEEVIALSENHPAVLTALFLEEAAESTTDLAFGELLPSVSLNGELSIDHDVRGEDIGTQQASITARVVIPLYQGGGTASRVRESKQFVAQRRREVDEARRAATEDATSAWQALETAQAQIKSFESEVKASQSALDGVIQEQQVGLRTVLDVLDAQQEVLRSQVSLVQAQRDELVAAYQVLAAIGRLTARDLNLPVEYYDVEVHYREVREKWWGLSASGQ